MTERIDWIGVRQGQAAHWYIPHKFRMRWLAHGHRILRKATAEDCPVPPSKLMPLRQAVREAAQRAVVVSPPPPAAEPKPTRSRRKRKATTE